MRQFSDVNTTKSSSSAVGHVSCLDSCQRFRNMDVEQLASASTRHDTSEITEHSTSLISETVSSFDRVVVGQNRVTSGSVKSLAKNKAITTHSKSVYKALSDCENVQIDPYIDNHVLLPQDQSGYISKRHLIGQTFTAFLLHSLVRPGYHVVLVKKWRVCIRLTRKNCADLIISCC